MPTIDHAQESFAVGELAPRLHGRVSSDLYKAALALCQDFRVTPQGNLLKRPGSRYVAKGWKGALRHIPSPDRRGYLVNFADESVACFSADGLFPRAGQALAHGVGQTYFELVQDGDFGADHDAWTVVSGGVVDWAEHPWHAIARGDVPATPGMPADCAVFASGGGKIRQAITAREAGTHSLRFSLVTSATGSPDTQVVALADGKTFQLRVGTSEGGAELLAFSETATTLWNGKKDASYRFDVEVPAAGTIYLELEADGFACFTGISLHSPSGYGLPAGPWTEAQLANIQTAVLQETGREGLVVVHPDVRPHRVWIDPFGVWHCDPITFTSEPTEWGESNWPSAVEVFQGRLWLAGCRACPDKFWGSKIDDLADFTIGDTATDALAYRLRARAGIRWMRGIRGALFMGTEDAEFSVSSQAGVICTTDYQISEESSRGSAKLPAMLVGSRLLYVSQDQRKLRALSFSQERAAWQSENLLSYAEHLTDGNGIEELAEVRNPDDVLAARRADGTLVCCTMGENMAAWWRCTLGGEGRVDSIVSIPGDPSVLWMLVHRGDSYFYETLTFTGQAADQYLDCWVAGTLVVATNSVSGLPYADGTNVTILDGSHVHELVPVSGGSGGSFAIHLGADIPAVVGLPFTSTATTLPIPTVSQRAKKRWPQAFAKLSNSALPKVAGERPPGAMDALVSKDVHTNSLGWGDGSISVEQERPFRTEIVSLFGKVSASQL
ncbi:MAG: hypothetical protein QM765_21010 [Myxococcales bacterium]